MKTLIELYDERAIENILGPEVFRPQKVIYLCPEDVMNDPAKKKVIPDYFAYRGIDMETEFVGCSMYKADKIHRLIKKLCDEEPDCAIDITGGTDAALFAAGMYCGESGAPVFTYSRKKNLFYDINNAPFADGVRCDIKYKVGDFFRMTGGSLKTGRVDNGILHSYMDKFEPFFDIFLKYKRKWSDEITYIQRISQNPPDEEPSLYAEGAYEQKGERGSRVRANDRLLYDLQKIGFISGLSIKENESVSFKFKDAAVRNWLRDVGSVLELYMYMICVESGIFCDVISSAVVSWDETQGHSAVSNEIDAAASLGNVPFFISCKACEIKTEALNELDILRDRFGGKGSKAVIVTTEPCSAAARHRAAKLGIAVMDAEELSKEKAVARIKAIAGITKNENGE